jgi:hypothetical protein
MMHPGSGITNTGSTSPGFDLYTRGKTPWMTLDDAHGVNILLDLDDAPSVNTRVNIPPNLDDRPSVNTNDIIHPGSFIW